MEQTIKERFHTFHPEKWDNKTHQAKKKKSIKASVPTLFHIPLPPMLGKKITKMTKMAEDSGKLSAEKEDILLLFNDPIAFKSELYLAVTSLVPNAKNTTLSGTFKSKVFDGAYKSIAKFMKQMDAYLSKQDIKANNYYVHYDYCPKCVKVTGHNYMVLFAKVA